MGSFRALAPVIGVDRDGKEDRFVHQAAGQGRAGQSKPADRSGIGSAWSQHHGILQGVQCADPGCRAGSAAAGGDHGLLRQKLHLHHQDPACDRAAEESGRHQEWQQGAHQEQGGQGHPAAGRRDRQAENARSDGGNAGGGRAHHCRQRAQCRHRSGGAGT